MSWLRLMSLLVALLIPGISEAQEWTNVASEGGSFSLTAPATVRYGVDTRWVSRAFPAGTHACGNAVFGDPAPFTGKACQRASEVAVPVGLPPCYPYESAARGFTIRTTPEGAAFLTAGPDAAFSITWWCQGRYTSTGRLVVGTKADLTSDFAARVGTFIAGTRAEKDALYRASIACRVTDSACARYAPLLEGARAQLASTRPAPIVWRVRDNPSGTTRPVFPVTGNVRSTVATRERVLEGAACSCTSLAIVEGSSTYCSVSGLPNASQSPLPMIDFHRVALCLP
jgi:hypothetical protein